MKKKFDQLIEKLKLDHRKYRQLINNAHSIVSEVHEIDDELDKLDEFSPYDNDLIQDLQDQKEDYLFTLETTYGELKQMNIGMSKQDYEDLIDYQNIRY